MTATFAGVVHGHLARGGCAVLASHIDLGLDAPVLDIAPFAAAMQPAQATDDPFAEAVE
jgi:heme exporter protein A